MSTYSKEVRHLPTIKEDPRETSRVLPLSAAKRRRPRPMSSVIAASSGNLALQLQPAAKVKPTPFPTPSRWFSEKNNVIGFRLFDIIYVFARARLALPADYALEWGARFFAGAQSETHARNVLAVLCPGQEDLVETEELPEGVRQAFRDAICQGAGRLLGRSNLQVEEITEEDARQLIEILEDMYERQRWLLPTIPLSLHMLLRKVDKDI